jgi:pterin-4a-carbinolamine dehydratase
MAEKETTTQNYLMCNKVTITLTTHDAKGVTDKDLI